MRPVCLFAAAVLGCASACTPGGSDAGAPPFRPVASVEELMHGIVIPASDVVFGAVVYVNGEPEALPESPEDWEAIEDATMALAESANLLMFPSRSQGRDWDQMSLNMIDAALNARDAAARQDVDALLAAGSGLFDTCLACHEQYVPEEE